MRILIVSMLVLSTLYMSCGKRHVRIDRDTRRTIDTLASREINGLRPVLDSMCLTKMDSLVASMRDSVLNTRRAEIRKLLGK